MTHKERTQYFEKLKKKMRDIGRHSTDHVKDHVDFLPPPENDESHVRLLHPFDVDLRITKGMPFLTYLNHAFIAVNRKWYIEPCPGMVALPCPVCELNRKAAKDVAARRKVKTQYIANAYCIRYTQRPQSENKVWYLKFGQQVLDKITDAINSDDDIDVFDPLEGSNLILRVSSRGSFPDYTKSSFDASTPLGDDDMIEKILAERLSLSALVSPDQFKSYDELVLKLRTFGE